MPVSEDEIRARFALNGSGQIVWKRIEMPSGTEAFQRLMRSALDQLNAKAGQVVEFWQQQRGGLCVRVAGSDVYETRIRRVLEGKAEPERAKRAKRERAVKSGAEARSAEPEMMKTCRMPDGSIVQAGPFGSIMEFYKWAAETGGRDINDL